MVYRGPSKGCRRCRARKIKRDALRPACLNCTARNTPCPGYGDIFDKAHRDETAKVRKLHSPKSKASRSVLSATRYTNQDVTSTCFQAPRGLSESSENIALGFFFLHYGQSIDPEATCSIFSILPEMFAKSVISSPLNHATRALALRVTCLHRSHVGKASGAGELYFKAVSEVKEALTDPTNCMSEDLLLATLVLDAYYTINTTFGKRKQDGYQSSPHFQGSIALLQHRGGLNYRNDLAWRLLAATRNRFLRQGRYMADGLVGFEAINKIWRYDDRRKPRRLAVEADTLAFRLSRLRNLHQALSTSSPSLNRTEKPPRIKLEDIEKLNEVESQASRLANDCALLHSSLPMNWQPTPIPASSLAPTIKATSVYRNVTPTIYLRLSISNAINRQRLTELECISLIGTCLAQIAGPEKPQCTPQQNGFMPSRLLRRAQVLMDEICASVPFMTGDVTADTWGDTTVLVPSVVLSSSEERGAEMVLPENPTSHRQQVVASGLYMMYGTLKALLNIVGSNTIVDVTGSVPRAGQVDWIVGQIDRLGAIFP